MTTPQQATGNGDSDVDEDALENAVWHDKHVADPGPLDIQTSTINGLLCCVRSRCLGMTCVLAPWAFFLLVFLCIPSSKSTLKRVFLIVSCVPPGLYLLSGLLLLCLVCKRQIESDTENAHTAHVYMQTRANLTKIAVTGGAQRADDAAPAVPGRFSLFLNAAREGNLVNFRWCLSNGQEVDQVDHLGRSALHWAAFSGTDEIVELLVRNGASLDLRDTLEQLTPLHYAAYYGHVKVTRLLVEAGVDTTIVDGRKMNPLQLAEMASLKLASVQPSHQIIIKFLRVAMKDDVTPPLEHVTGLTVLNLVERQTKGAN